MKINVIVKFPIYMEVQGKSLIFKIISFPSYPQKEMKMARNYAYSAWAKSLNVLQEYKSLLFQILLSVGVVVATWCLLWHNNCLLNQYNILDCLWHIMIYVRLCQMAILLVLEFVSTLKEKAANILHFSCLLSENPMKRSKPDVWLFCLF